MGKSIFISFLKSIVFHPSVAVFIIPFRWLELHSPPFKVTFLYIVLKSERPKSISSTACDFHVAKRTSKFVISSNFKSINFIIIIIFPFNNIIYLSQH